MIKILRPLALLILAWLLILAGCGDEGEELPPRGSQTGTYAYYEKAEEVIEFADIAQAQLALGKICSAVEQGNPQQADWTVVSIQDGDTIEISDGRRIRYIGIDAPESPHDGGEAEPYAEQATDYNRRLMRGARVRLALDTEHPIKDRYGRTLAYVFVSTDAKGGWKFVNAEMVLAGYALAKRFPPNTRHAAALSALEELAARKKRGMWKTTPSGYIGNRNSMIFHRRICKYGKKMRQKHRVEFSTRKQALTAGYRACRVCKP